MWPSLGGIAVTTQTYLCQTKPIRPSRPHRRPRIRKKWLKRYGWVMGGCTGHGYEVAGIGIVGCSCFVARLKAALPTASHQEKPCER